MAELLHIEVDPISLAKMRALSQYGRILQIFLMPAVQLSLEDMEADAQNYMWANFQNPTGALEDNFAIMVLPLAQGAEGTLENDSPYAWRREKGFSGMTDSLGRFFADDPGIDYMDYAFYAGLDNALLNVQTAVDDALLTLGVI